MLGTMSCVRGLGVAVVAVGVMSAVAATAQAGSLYTGPGPRPGPKLLYSKPAKAPQLANAGIWKAKPILVSGTTAYRRGEFLYQDYLYDDNGARQTPDPADPRTAGNLFSKPNGTYTYPTGEGYNNNAADFVELRVKPLHKATALRVTLNTLLDPSKIAFSIGIGRGKLREFPFGANVRAPAKLFVTVHPSGKRLVADHKGPVKLSLRRRQIDARVPHRAGNPKR